MIRRTLGRTSIHLSEIAFGCVEIGLPYGIGVKDEAGMPTEKEAIRLLHAAVEGGINFFDTARLYGKSENLLGKAFGDRRHQIVLSSKCRHFRNHDGSLPGDRDIRALIEASVKESLHALQTGYLDVFMLHQADMEILENETIASVFCQLKDRGIVRAIGASTYRTEETEKAIASGIWDVVQLPFSLMDQRQGVLFELAEKNGVGVVVRSVLLKGLLSNRAENLHPALHAVRRHIGQYDELVGDDVVDLPTLAVKFALSFHAVSSVLVGIDRLEYLASSLAAADGQYLNPTLLERAQKLAYPDPAFLDLPRWEKLGWLT